jgi:ERCC4-type nuclease
MNEKFAIERKMSLDELASCFTHDRERFEREFQRATDAGARMLLIVENANYENLLNHKYRSRFNPEAFIASLTVWEIRYGFHVVMCKEETTPKLIYEWCKRDLKERLEHGEF